MQPTTAIALLSFTSLVVAAPSLDRRAQAIGITACNVPLEQIDSAPNLQCSGNSLIVGTCLTIPEGSGVQSIQLFQKTAPTPKCICYADTKCGCSGYGQQVLNVGKTNVKGCSSVLCTPFSG